MTAINADNLVLRLRAMSKRYPGVVALDHVDLDLRAGEVHALIGENGAGKSTLAGIIAGLRPADDGEMQLAGRAYAPASRRVAEAAGVRMVMQELNLIGELSIAENIFLDKLPRRGGWVRYARLYEQTRCLLEQFGMAEMDPATPINRLGVGRRQLVEIARGLRQDCRVLLLDEPTASLTDVETKVLFEHIRRLRSRGVAIVYISHRMEEISRIADRITILRDGRRVGEYLAGELSTEQMIHHMVGRELSAVAAASSATAEIILRVEGLSRPPRVREVSFDLHRGEILGFAGLNGAGRTETMRCLFGADRPQAGEVFLYGGRRPVRIASPAQAVKHGIAWLSEDRKDEGLILAQAICRNITLTRMAGVSRGGWIHFGRERQVGQTYRQTLDIRCPDVEQSAGSLSGGNQQKIVLAKWLWRDCNILICDEPTRGIDVGAKFEIYRLLRQLAAAGKAIILISSELSELLALCDRIAVMSAGRLTAILNRETFNQEAIMAAAFAEHLKSSVLSASSAPSASKRF